ncbi:MAG: acyltransferase [Bdellovibrionota bacterium]
MSNSTNNPIFKSDEKSSSDYLYYIALLRALAILGVIFAHLNGFINLAFGTKDVIFNLNWPIIAGKHGVTLFFLISAYTLCRSFYKRSAESKAISRYFIRRFFRIAPAYYFILIVVFLVFGTAIDGYYEKGAEFLTLNSLWLHFTFLNSLWPAHTNNFLGVEWSTSTEFMFYFILPFLFINLVKLKKPFHILFGATLIYMGCLLSYFLTYYRASDIFSTYSEAHPQLFAIWSSFLITSHLHTFLLGIIAWILLDIIKLPNKLKTAIQKAALPIITVLIFVYVCAGYLESYYYSYRTVRFSSLIFWSVFSFSILILSSSANLKKNKFFSHIGDLSFSLYLVHMPVFYYMTKYFSFSTITPYLFLNITFYVVSGLLTTYSLSFLLFEYIEKPGVKFGHALARK